MIEAHPYRGPTRLVVQGKPCDDPAARDLRNPPDMTGLSSTGRLRWSIDYYAASTDAQQDLTLNIGTLPGVERALLRSNRALETDTPVLRP